MFYGDIIREDEKWRPILEAAAWLSEECSRIAVVLEKNHEIYQWAERLGPWEIYNVQVAPVAILAQAMLAQGERLLP